MSGVTELTPKDIQPPEAAPTQELPDQQTGAWQEEQHREHGQLRNQEFREVLALRKAYARRLFIFLCIWLLLILGIIFLAAWGLWGFKLSDKVLITLLTTSTVNVIALVLVVVKFLFPGDGSNGSPS